MSLTSRLSFLYYFFVLFIPFASSLSITGATGGIVSGSRIRPFRQEINEFSNSGASWDLFILALQRFQNTSITDELSYFQVVGIHGFPTRPWDGVAGENVEQGFCMHNSVLFPVWHRPYLALYEVCFGTQWLTNANLRSKFCHTMQKLSRMTIHQIRRTHISRQLRLYEHHTGIGLYIRAYQTL